uniref:HEAT repeat-containing protein 5B n=1 Tax=Schistocephalus solidus TaxID=70667 RepID=A0A0X3P7M8_SCHSO
MENHPRLLLDEDAFSKAAEQNRPIFLYDWLRNLDKNLSNSTEAAVKSVQQALIKQVLEQLRQNIGPPIQALLGKCLVKIFNAGDSLSLYSAINTCIDILKVKDDTPATVNRRLAALVCLGIMYRCLGRLCGRSFEETVSILIKMMKQVESQTRYEILNTLKYIVLGLGNTDTSCYRDIFKTAKSYMSDRVMSVRLAAAQCHYSLALYNNNLYSADLDATVSMCLRGLEGSTYPIRLEIAKLLGHVLASSVAIESTGLNGTASATANVGSGTGAGSAPSVSGPYAASGNGSRNKLISLEDALNILHSGFVRGLGRFHKGASAPGMLKVTNAISREVRVGISYAYVEFFTNMGSDWLVDNSLVVISHCLSLLCNPRTTQRPAEAECARFCVSYILSTILRRNLSEAAQIAAAHHFVHLISLRRHGGPVFAPGLRSVGSSHVIAEIEATSFELPSTTTTAAAELATPARATTSSDDPHYLVCALDQLTQLIGWLDSAIAPLLSASVNLPSVIFEVCLPHASLTVRAAAAATIRQLAIALPSQRVLLMDRCINGLQSQSTCPEALLGYSFALAGLVAGVRLGGLGIPRAKAKAIFLLGEDLLRAANQNSRLTSARTQAGWLLIGAYMVLGPTSVRQHLPRMILLWRNAFPRSARELEAEKQRGDAFTWQVTLEARAGALCSIQAFLEYCAPAMSAENVTRRLLPTLECALNLLSHLPDIVRSFGSHLAPAAALVRLRLYRCLSLLPPTSFACGFNVLLRELVAEFTLTDSTCATPASLLSLLCHNEDSVVLSSWHQETDQEILESGLDQFGFSSPDPLGKDPAFLLLRDGLFSALSPDRCTSVIALRFLTEGTSTPNSCVLNTNDASTADEFEIGLLSAADTGADFRHQNGVIAIRGAPSVATSLINASVDLFGSLFPYVSVRHRTQMLEHFAECIRVSKAARQEAIQVNIFAAFLCALRKLAETKYSFGDDAALRSTAVSLSMSALSSQNPVLRFAAAECVGRLAQVVGEPVFLAELTQSLFDQLRSVRDTVTRAGICLAIGCLHRFVGGLACGQHLSTSVGVLLAVAQDASAPLVQAWALHALALTAESGGPMFREFVQPSLNLVLRLLLKVSFTATEVHVSLAKLLGALITTLGPELQSSVAPKSNAGLICLSCCSILQEHPDPRVKAEGITNYQRLHMFAPHLVNLTQFAPHLYSCLLSKHLVLRRAAVACIRQMSQKEANEICEAIGAAAAAAATAPGALTFAHKLETGFLPTALAKPAASLPLEAILFSLLDVESHFRMRRDIEETLLSLLQSRGTLHLSGWIRILKQLLQMTANKFGDAETASGILADCRTTIGASVTREEGMNDLDGTGTDEDEDEEIFGKEKGSNSPGKGSIFNLPPRWPTRMLAVACLRKLILLCHEAYTTAASIKGYPGVLRNAPLQAAEACAAITSSTSKAFGSDQLAHFDLSLARKLRKSADLGVSSARQQDRDGWLVLHLSDLIRMVFISATCAIDQLRIFGLIALRDLIRCFAPLPDPDSPGSSLLQQFEAQVSAALRPAFPSETGQQPPAPNFPNTFLLGPGPDVTAAACEVCSCWLTSGVASDAADVLRVHTLLAQSLAVLREGGGDNVDASEVSSIGAIYGEAALTRLRLAVLCAWADVYITTMRYRDSALQATQLMSVLESGGESTNQLTTAMNRGQVPDVDPTLLLFSARQLWSRASVTDFLEFASMIERVDSSLGRKMELEEEERELNGGYKSTVVSGKMTTDDVIRRKRDSFLLWLRQMANQSMQAYKLLSRLVQSDLAELSSDWLAALRDYALVVSLPEELAFQRPTTAGAFYEASAPIEQIRPYYARSWLTLLEAAALCLNAETTVLSTPTETSGDLPQPNPLQHQTLFPFTPDSFFLIFGMSMEAMSILTAKAPSRVISKCLRIVELLLSKPQSREQLLNPLTLAIELLSVLHRVILTRDGVYLHLSCIRVLNLTLLAVDEKLKTAFQGELASASTDVGDSARGSLSVNPADLWCSSASATLEELTASLICPLAFTSASSCSAYALSASDLARVSALLELADGGPRSCLASEGHAQEQQQQQQQPRPQALNDTSERPFSFVALQVIVCVLARYHPSVLQDPGKDVVGVTSGNTSADDRSQTRFPKTLVSHHRRAPLVLANAINCLNSLMRLCSPRLLSPDASASHRLSGFLPIICRLVCTTTELELLHGHSGRPVAPHNSDDRSSGTLQLSRSDSPGVYFSSDLHTLRSSNAAAIDDVSLSRSSGDVAATGESDITSTTTTEPQNHLFDSRSCGGGVGSGLSFWNSFSLLEKLGWSPEQTYLAESCITLFAAVAQHRCRPTKKSRFVESLSEVVSKSASADSVEDGDHTKEETVTSSSSSSNGTSVTLGQPPIPVDNDPDCEWHKILIDCICGILNHSRQHPQKFAEAPPCCLAQISIAARLVAISPLCVFRSKPVEFGIFDALIRTWKNASAEANTAASSLPNLQPLNGQVTRFVCLSAIELLINHSDADISACCVKTLMPQVIHWLYELSVCLRALPEGPLETLSVGDFKPIGFSLKHLEEAVDAAIALCVNVVDIAEATGRRNLLVILLPLFCDLLLDSTSSSDVIDDLGISAAAAKSPQIAGGAIRRLVHGLAFRSLLSLGSRYPTEFRHVCKVADLKPRLESAVKSQTSSNVAASSTTTTTSAAAGFGGSNCAATAQTTASSRQQPRIKLKLEFSGFT